MVEGRGPYSVWARMRSWANGKDQQSERRKDRLNAVKRVSAYLVGC